MSIIPSYDIEEIILKKYNPETRNIILSNFKNYTKLKKFNCSSCNLTKLPNLPNSLIELWCYDNKLTKLPKLPTSLENFGCGSNNLTELPNLPNLLKSLYCHNNILTELPDLPNSLKYLSWDDNNLDFTYPNLEIKTINEIINEINKINLKNRIIKRMKILNRTLLLEWSAMISMNPKRIERLLNTNEIDFYDGSFDTLTS